MSVAQNIHIHTQPFYGSLDFVRGKPGEPEPEETFTHSHLSWSSIVPYLLHPSNMIPHHPHCSIYMPDSRFPQSLSKSSSVYPLARHLPPHTPHTSSPNHRPPSTAHAYIIATRPAARPCHPIPVSPQNTHTHTQPFYCSSVICPGPPGWALSRYQKVKPGRL